VNLRPDEALSRAFATLAVDPEASEWDAAVLVNRVIDPGVRDVSIQPLLESVPGMGGESSWRLLEHLGFRGDDDALRNLDNSCIARVMERRRGLPITLALILIELARSRGEPAWGLNTPGHFLACVKGEVIDPVRMSPLPVTGDLPRADTVDVALRMLNNIKQVCLERRQPHSVLVILEHQRGMAQALDHDGLSAGLHLESGNCWFALNMPELAREHFESCVALSPEGSEMHRNAQMRIRLLGKSRPPTMH
jgi:regulator of sirC expression with transglutaminase-like and TPR domain